MKLTLITRGSAILGASLVYGLLILVGKLSDFSIQEWFLHFFDATILFLVPAFIHNYKLVQFFDNKKYITYFLLLLSGLIILTFANYGYENLFTKYNQPGDRTFLTAVSDSLTVYVLVVIALAIYRVWKRSTEATKSKLLLREMELKTLTSQIHPHFLFNTLNALYNMSLKGDPSLPDSMLKLSELMRYLLEAGKKEIVPLDQEIEYLGNYVGLEKIRLGENLKVNFCIEGNSSPHQIAPLILLPFVENAFKHGVEQIGANALVEVTIDIQAKQLFFHVSNTKPKLKMQHQESGTGLSNVKRRLDLLYGGKHELQITDSFDKFEILLSLNF